MLTRFVLVSLTLSLTGCSFWKGSKQSSSGGDVAKPEPLYESPLGLTGELGHFASCQELESWLKEEALKRTAHNMAWDKYYFFSAANGGIIKGMPTEAPAAPGDTAEVGNSAGGQTSTNNQVAGVDENDSVKHVGDRLYTLSANTLHVVKSWPASDMAVEGKLAFSYRPESMLLAGDRALVFGQTWDNTSGTSGPTSSSMPVPDIACQGCWGGNLVTALVDLKDHAKPTLISEKKHIGQLLAARQVGSVIRYVMQSSPMYPKDFRWDARLYEANPSSPEEADGIIAAVMEENAKLLADRKLKDWFSLGDALLAQDCQNVYRPSAQSELALTSVITLDPASGNEQVTAILAQSSEVYASEKNLYVANHYYGGRETNFGSHTFIHKFSLAADATAYEASGGVEGWILNQFALDEKDEHLRIAVTAMNDSGKTVNRVLTLAQSGGRLNVAGQTSDLAENERIYSVRFDGDKGYVVTFRQIDPLFVLDLANPGEPKVVGELKIPGFSSYLHKVGENRLLGVGRQDSFMKLSLFDVTDPSAPRELNALLVEGWTDVGYDHHSFAYAPWLSTFVVPRSSVNNYGTSTFRIEGDALVKGKFFNAPQGADGWLSGGQGLRSVFRDNMLYSLSAGGIAVRDLSQDGLLVKSIAYP